jgi:hypothetical protein
VDAADPGCASASDDLETALRRRCDDGLDNDGDFAIDAFDPGCAFGSGASESPPCDDGRDDDGDGWIDADDPHCTPGSAGTEAPLPRCGVGAELAPLLAALALARRMRRGARSAASRLGSSG